MRESEIMDNEEESDACEKLSKCFRDNILQALEELRVKRKLEVTNAERINQLLEEKFELSRQKDELACTLQKDIDSLAQKLAKAVRELQEAKEKLFGFERKQKSSEKYENEGIKVLKEEVIALQLAKHNLAKKLKEQDYQYNMQSTAKENLIKQLKNVQDRMKLVEQQREKTQNELMNIEASVQKATLFQNRILRVNNHQQCRLDRLKSDLVIANQELLQARTTVNKFSYGVNRCEENGSYGGAKKIAEPRNDLIKEKLEEQLELVKKENDRLLQELSKQSDLTSQLNNRLTAISTSEMGLHFVIDDLKAENAKLRITVDRHDLIDKDVQTAEEALHEKKGDEDVLLEDEISESPVFSQNAVKLQTEDMLDENNVLKEAPDALKTEITLTDSEKDLKEELS